MNKVRLINAIKLITSIVYAIITLIGISSALIISSNFNVVIIVIMGIGSVMLILSNLEVIETKIYIPFLSLLSIYISDFIKGLDMGNINIVHIILRLLVSCTIFSFFSLYKYSILKYD